MRLRIPAWAHGATLRVNAQPLPAAQVRPGTYAAIRRQWSPGDAV
ncbi:MAG TPA: glycoside hydrolase family 127 protein, partial [Candidatus Hydrogenedentes bacterium]|nr:glycoside hydrolase family 127 protein [Candidatus Hydrogenedentota bacterium]